MLKKFLFPLFVVLLALSLGACFQEREKLTGKENVICEGVYQTAIYPQYGTAIHFLDGRICVIEAKKSMSYPTGTAIRVIEYNCYLYKGASDEICYSVRIEKVPPPEKPAN